MRKPSRSSVNEALRQAQIAWLTLIERETAKTATEIARKADLHPSTLTRFKADDTRTLEALTITAIANAWGIPASAEVRGSPTGAGFADDASPYTAGQETALDSAVAAIVGKRNAVDPWVLKGSALEGAGYLAGDILIVDMNATPRSGDIVCAQVYDWQRGRAETVFRQYREAGAIALLLGARYGQQDPGPMLVDNDRVIIKGVVTDSLRRRRGLPLAANQ